MAIEIVTGFQGKSHVTANDIGSFQQGVCGTDNYVLNVGKKAEATLVSNNSVRINDGELVMQGVHWRIKPGTYENVTINNGTQGRKRKDAIVARYTKNSSSGIEKIELAVLQGTATTGTPVAPTPTKGDIRAGTLKNEMLLYIVELNGLNVVSVTPAFGILLNMNELKEITDQLKTKLTNTIMIKNYEKDNVTIASGATEVLKVKAPAITGYSRGIYTVSVFNATSSGANSSYCVCFQSLLSGDEVSLSVRNYANSSAKIRIAIRMEYIATSVVGSN